ncbi:ankyrin repeat-containing domain protein [Podospora fimiseda]|uniref:Ankyrin repeat-containing domain protein n=1 Tax=Podospora fimiseda TaxID=252190 RepID=A0AAN7BFJ0_9PEZI|nr:ankyrin repeat-containing domain protein [Podospora fimiseda]
MTSNPTPSPEAQCIQKVKSFLVEYKKPQTQKLFQDLAEVTKQRCEELLSALNIKGIVTSRYKKYESLETKLIGMAKDPEFVQWSQSAGGGGGDPRRGRSVYEHPDMGDLAGVRIGLFFPDDIATVGKKINETFDIAHTFGSVIDTSRSAPSGRNVDVQKHGEGRWTSEGPDGKPDHWEHYGYKSWQVVVTWKRSQPASVNAGVIGPLMKIFGSQPPPRIEIQVGTIVTQAWAEVQHNIIYKNPNNIKTTATMKRMIDAINGLAITTDIMLRELQRSQIRAEKEAAEWRKLRKSPQYYNLMAQACTRGDLGTVRSLLQKGIDVNMTSQEGKSVLWPACGYGHINIVQELLRQEGIKINIRSTDDEKTPLFAAAVSGEDDIVKLLIQQGSDVNIKDKNGQTALFSPCEKGDSLVVAALVGGGIDVNVKDKRGLAALHIAAEKGHDAVVGQLLRKEGLDVNVRESNGRTPLHIASKYGQEKVVRQLLASRRVEVNAKDHSGATALDCASIYAKHKIVAILEAAGTGDQARQRAPSSRPQASANPPTRPSTNPPTRPSTNPPTRPSTSR